jgi:pimeloyl-ACP methyl ester carboxylesterase
MARDVDGDTASAQPPRFVLAHNTIALPDSPPPTRWMMFLHGLLGSRSNWRAIATRFVAARPGWGALLVDLRMHGESQAFSPPHTIETAARDLIALEASLSFRPDAVLGHSFGGKVALQYLDLLDRNLEAAWIIDSPPGPRVDANADPTTLRVLDRLRQMPRIFESRNKFVEQLTTAGFDEPLARWLALNLVRRDDGLVLRVDIEAIAALLDSHYHADLWPTVERHAATTAMTFVIGGRSSVFVPDQRARIYDMAKAGKLRVVTLETSGHWVHADDPDGLLACIVRQRNPGVG